MTMHSWPETRLNTFSSMRVSSIESPSKTHCGFAFLSRRSGFSSNGRRGDGPSARSVGTPRTITPMAPTPTQLHPAGGVELAGAEFIEKDGQGIQVRPSRQRLAREFFGPGDC